MLQFDKLLWFPGADNHPYPLNLTTLSLKTGTVCLKGQQKNRCNYLQQLFYYFQTTLKQIIVLLHISSNKREKQTSYFRIKMFTPWPEFRWQSQPEKTHWINGIYVMVLTYHSVVDFYLCSSEWTIRYRPYIWKT